MIALIGLFDNRSIIVWRIFQVADSSAASGWQIRVERPVAIHKSRLKTDRLTTEPGEHLQSIPHLSALVYIVSR